jgi:hypothetical protein
MKKIVFILLSITICIACYSQNKNAALVEELCRKSLEYTAPGKNPSSEQLEKIAYVYVQGTKHSHCTELSEDYRFYFIGECIYELYYISVVGKPTDVEGARVFSHKVRRLKERTEDYIKQLEEIYKENHKIENRTYEQVDFKDLI